MQINISLNKKILYNFWGTQTCRFSFDWGEKKSEEIGRWEHWSHLTKWRYWSGEEKIPPDRDWWVGSVWKNFSQWGAKRRASGRFYTCQRSTKGHECEIQSWKKLLFPFSLDKSLFARSGWCVHCVWIESKEILLYMWKDKRSRSCFSRTEGKEILGDQTDNWW